MYEGCETVSDKFHNNNQNKISHNLKNIYFKIMSTQTKYTFQTKDALKHMCNTNKEKN